jgi:hypothetical protein
MFSNAAIKSEIISATMLSSLKPAFMAPLYAAPAAPLDFL